MFETKRFDDGELRWLDQNLGSLLEWIDAEHGEDTVVIITSDHGEDLGEDGIVGHEVGLSQSLIHVPLFVRAPGLMPKRVAKAVSGAASWSA